MLTLENAESFYELGNPVISAAGIF